MGFYEGLYREPHTIGAFKGILGLQTIAHIGFRGPKQWGIRAMGLGFRFNPKPLNRQPQNLAITMDIWEVDPEFYLWLP